MPNLCPEPLPGFGCSLWQFCVWVISQNSNKNGRVPMKTIAVMCLAGLLLAACGTTTGDRGLSGAGIGAGIGVIGGPPGMVLGGAIGAGVGMVTSPSKVNLGKPAWKS
jgi:hypothetical protein